MKFWIDLINGEYGMVADSTDLSGLAISGEGSMDPLLTERMAARAREEGGVLVMEEIETFQTVFGTLEEALGMSFIHSPVAPTCAGFSNRDDSGKWADYDKNPGLVRRSQALAA